MANEKRPLMGAGNILELQNNGYKSTVSAISEIVDNSIQANAQNIDIILIRNTIKADEEISEILIVDDGDGMNQDTFNKALQMSSGSRSKAKNGLGKYGQGLPNSSISQTKRVEVYTMQKESILYNHIDLDEIYESGEAFLPNTEKRKEIDIPIVKLGKYSAPAKGTIVRWVAPNKVKPKTAKTLASHIEQLAARTFRYYIAGFKDKDGKKYKSKINILVFDYNGQNYEPNDFSSIKNILPFDPMFLMENTKMNLLFPECNHPTSVLYPEEMKKSFKVLYHGEEVETTVEIRLSYCKKEERDRYGRNAGDSLFGKKYLNRNLIGTSGYNNISIIRSGREIDYGNFGFISSVSDTRERWWSAEILIEPVIDSIIGIDDKKQQAANIQFLDSEDSESADHNEIIIWISQCLTSNINAVKKIISDQMAKTTLPPGDGMPEPGGGLPPGGASEPGEPLPTPPPSEPEENKIKVEFRLWIKERYPEIPDKEINEIVNYSLSIKDSHIFIKSDLGDSQLYSYKVFGTKVLIEINFNHSFYINVIQPLEGDPNQSKSLRSIRLLISAMVNSEIVNSTKDSALLSDRRKIRNRMSESLDDYIKNLYS